MVTNGDKVWTLVWTLNYVWTNCCTIKHQHLHWNRSDYICPDCNLHILFISLLRDAISLLNLAALHTLIDGLHIHYTRCILHFFVASISRALLSISLSSCLNEQKPQRQGQTQQHLDITFSGGQDRRAWAQKRYSFCFCLQMSLVFVSYSAFFKDE